MSEFTAKKSEHDTALFFNQDNFLFHLSMFVSLQSMNVSGVAMYS